MDKRELAYTKQTLLTVKDWDGFQEVLRYFVKILRAKQGGSAGGSGKRMYLN